MIKSVSSIEAGFFVNMSKFRHEHHSKIISKAQYELAKV